MSNLRKFLTRNSTIKVGHRTRKCLKYVAFITISDILFSSFLSSQVAQCATSKRGDKPLSYVLNLVTPEEKHFNIYNDISYHQHHNLSRVLPKQICIMLAHTHTHTHTHTHRQRHINMYLQISTHA